MTASYQVQTPGKLYLAGEYAVLSPSGYALIKSIPIYMVAQISANDQFCISSDMFDYTVDRRPDVGYALIQETMSLFEAYLGYPLKPCRLDISGKMEKDGKKYGLGSSGSVVILILKALASFEGIVLEKERLFQLACLVLLQRGDKGSMGDVACIAYEQSIAYRSFDREKIARAFATEGFSILSDRQWGYHISPMTITLEATFMVGWTREPAISNALIRQVKSAITPDFITHSYHWTKELERGLEKGQKSLVKLAFDKLNQLLSDLHPAISTSKLDALIALSHAVGGVAKPSGAGGGDCGIALVFDNKDVSLLAQSWSQQEIDLLYTEDWRHYES